MLATSNPQRLHSYVVRFDSGFAPNPFYGYCTLATCKPDIRKTADVGDWILGCGSANKTVKRGGYVVYAMRVSEALSFPAYWEDIRFFGKRPIRTGSMKQTCGDNIYFPVRKNKRWSQLDSFHSKADGTPNQRHITRDTGVNRVLVADEFYYFGGSGPKIPQRFRLDTDICHSGRGRTVIRDSELVSEFAAWCRSLGVSGYLGEPWDWRNHNA